MEATIQSTNRAINIDINVSINVDALKAIIQRGLQAIWNAIKQWVRTVDVRRVISNLWIGGWAAAYIYLIYMYA